MKKLESSLRNMVFVLVVAAMVTGGLLAWVNHITETPIRQQAKLALAEGVKMVMGGKPVKVERVDSISQWVDNKESCFVIHHIQGGGAAVETVTMGFGGDLKLLVGFSADGAILGYTVLQHAETPGLGAKADAWFQRGHKGNIIGKSPRQAPLTVKQDGGGVDAITASTITSRAFLKAVNQAYQAYTQGNVDTHTGATKHEKKG